VVAKFSLWFYTLLLQNSFEAKSNFSFNCKTIVGMFVYIAIGAHKIKVVSEMEYHKYLPMAAAKN